jgi:hypothetical protein
MAIGVLSASCFSDRSHVPIVVSVVVPLHCFLIKMAGQTLLLLAFKISLKVVVVCASANRYNTCVAFQAVRFNVQGHVYYFTLHLVSPFSFLGVGLQSSLCLM